MILNNEMQRSLLLILLVKSMKAKNLISQETWENGENNGRNGKKL